MIPSVIIIAVIAAVIYAGITQHEPISSTASAIVEIWSGNCRQACRHSETTMPHHDEQILNHRGAGPSSGCVCGACPCLLIDNMIMTVSPAMTCYCHFISYLSDFICMFARVLNEIINQTVRVLDNRIACQHNSQAKGIDEQNLADTVSYAEERRPNKREPLRSYEDTIRQTFSSTFDKNKASEDASGKQKDKELGKKTAVSDTPSAAASPLPPQDQHRVSKTHFKSESPKTPVVELDRKEASKAATSSVTASKPFIEPERKEATKTETKLETAHEASKPSVKQEHKEASKTATKPETTYGASTPSAKLEIKEISRKATKPETASEVPEPESKTVMKPGSKLTLKPESKLTLKPESKLTLKPESKSSGKPEPANARSNFSEAGTSYSAPSKQYEVGTTVSKIEEVDSATTQTQSVCRKCIERGKTCVGGCPRAQLTDLSSDKSD